jgi:hypothetical protein
MDNSMKHTTGPWATRGWSITGPTAAADYVATEAVKDAMPEVFVHTIGQADGIGKAAVCTAYGMSAEEAEANARLLAAAPDLATALKSLMESLDRPYDGVAGLPISAIVSINAQRRAMAALAAAGVA